MSSLHEKINGGKRKDTLQKVLQYIGNYKLLLIVSMVLAAFSVVLTLYVPILFGDAIDAMIGKGQVDFAIILFYAKRIAIVVCVTAVMQWVMNTVNNRMTYHIVRDIRAKAFRRLHNLPLSYLDGHSYGDIVSRIIADVDQFADGLLMGLTQLFTGVVTIICTLLFMMMKSVPITLLVVILTPLSFLVARFIATRTFAMFKLQSETRGDQTALIEEMVGHEKIVKAFGYEDRAKERFEKINDKLEAYSLKAVFYSSLTNPATRCVNSIIYAAVALFGGFLCIAGGLTVGGLSVLLSYANQYAKPFNDISSVVTELQNALACAERVFELMEAQEQTPEKPEVMPTVEGNISLQNVCFSYDKSKKLITDLSLDVKPGMRIAIVGPTGCGKTTLINLLMRFYDIDEGAILVDGTSIYDVTRHSLRRNFGMVLQETWLQNASVRDNIIIGKPDATEEEIWEAAKEAHSASFIKRLPQGMDTILTDESLSQGQKQLLCITRVMLALPPMLILDEATSSIDTRTEVKIQEAFLKLMEGRTSFIVAHRLSTIRSADVILVMKDGHVIEQGNHETLMQQGGFYCNLYNSQYAK